MAQEGVLHRHADGREHRHFSAGFTIGSQVRADDDGDNVHTHGILGEPVRGQSGPVVWVEHPESYVCTKITVLGPAPFGGTCTATVDDPAIRRLLDAGYTVLRTWEVHTDAHSLSGYRSEDTYLGY